MEIVKVFENFKYNPSSRSIEGYTESDVTKIREAIERYDVVVLKAVYDKQALDRIKQATFSFFMENDPSNPPITETTANYFRIDDNPEKAAVKRVNQFYASFYWNQDLAGEVQLLKAMSQLKNRIAKLPENFTFNGIENGYFTYANITHYPRGGGRLNKHRDPKNIQFCVITCCMSTRGDEFQQGGLYVERDEVRYDLENHIQCGDVYLINPDIVHGVEDIDPDVGQPQWRSAQGRWMLFPSLIELKTTQGVKVEGLQDLERVNHY